MSIKPKKLIRKSAAIKFGFISISDPLQTYLDRFFDARHSYFQTVPTIRYYFARLSIEFFGLKALIVFLLISKIKFWVLTTKYKTKRETF